MNATDAEEPAIIAGAGWAQMAWKRAQDRIYRKNTGVIERRLVILGANIGPSAEFYRLCDIAWRERGKARVSL